MQKGAVGASPQTEQNNLIGKVTAGYQAWFHASGDPDTGWFHWSYGSAPEAGNVHPEMFPDFGEYPDSVMYPSRFEPYPDGSPVRFYEAHEPETIEVHFRWMKEYGIDGVGIQRFYGETSAITQPEPTHLTAIRSAAEKYDRIFYIMYDTTGCGRDGSAAVARMKEDFIHNIEEKGLTASPAYAHADEKPVVCIWGLAGTEPGRYPAAKDALELVSWLKERGYFVIGGLPDNRWTEITDEYAAVYAALDMASPWTPGRFRKETLHDWISRHLEKDLRYCKEHGMYYQPVMFSGFAWSNFNGGGNPNATPRDAGRFLWEQAGLYAKAGVNCGYFAMFDEYDEATALAKAATDSSMIPAGRQYFQTLSADGTWLSSDFYLRLAGAVTGLLRGEIPYTEEVPVPHSNGSVYFRNGFEKRYASLKLRQGQAQDSRLCNIDVCDAHAKVLYQEAVQLETAAVVCGQRGEVAYTGTGGFAFSGFGMTDGTCEIAYQLAETEIPVVKGLTLSYWLRPMDEGGSRVGADLLFEDGKRFSELCPEVLASRVPANRKEEGAKGWIHVTLPLPDGLAGKTIKSVLISFRTQTEQRFAAYLDDIVLEVPKA